MIMNIEEYVNSKLEEFEKELDKKREEFKQSLNEEITQMTKPKTVWDLRKADEKEYYYLSLDESIGQVCFNSRCDEAIRDLGNAFLTREDAEFEAERKKVETTLRKYSRPFKEGSENWHIEYDHDSNTLCTNVFRHVNAGTPYFETLGIAKSVIKEIGECRLKKYWFGIAE